MSKWKKLSSRQVYKSEWNSLREDRVITPEGKESTYAVFEIGLGVSVIPVDEDGRIWMVKHYRYIFDDSHWELVAGDRREDERPEEAANRELGEEMGLKANSLEIIGYYRPSNGSTDEEVDIVLAQDLEQIELEEDEPDILERKKFSFSEIEEMIKAGDVVDSFSIVAMHFYKSYLEKKVPSPGEERD